MAEIVKLGSIYFDGKPQKVGKFWNNKEFFFGDSVPGLEISWVKLKNGLLIADRCVFTKVSWEQLHEGGFVFGTKVTMDGKPYICRCPKVGTDFGQPNEWDTALDETGDSNDFWHWKKKYFWGQESSPDYDAEYRVVRGHSSARELWNIEVACQDSCVGFRPILEPLGAEVHSPAALLGKKGKVYCIDWVAIEGWLVDFSDYDVVLKPSSPVLVECSWITKDGSNIIISRGNITRLEEV